MRTQKESHKSKSFFDKNGFVQEGVIKEALWFKGNYHDVYIYGMTRDLFYKNNDQ